MLNTAIMGVGNWGTTQRQPSQGAAARPPAAALSTASLVTPVVGDGVGRGRWRRLP